MAAPESISQRIDAIDDPATQRAMSALFNSFLTDINTLKAAHNTHIHTSTGATADTTVPKAAGLVGNLNTSA